jgi:ankyrin repeat protein
MIRALAGKGGDPLVRTKDGTTALKAAIGVATITENRRGRMGVATLDPDEEEQLALECARLAIDLGIDVNAANDVGETALHDAAKQGFNSVVELLVARGANPNVKNKRNETPLALAERRPSDSGIRALVREDLRSTADLLRKLGATN